MCCVIDYDTKDDTNWKASILAYSVKEAIEFIQKQVPTMARINTTEAGRQIDAFETQVMKDFFTENVVEEIEIEIPIEVEVPVEIIKEVEVEKIVYRDKEDNGESKCPWCKKAFKSENTLKTHCRKYHLKDD